MATPTSGAAWRATKLSGNPIVDGLLTGTQWASGSLTYSFPTTMSYWSTAPDAYGPSTGTAGPWSAFYAPLPTGAQFAVRSALEAWASVARLNFAPSVDTQATVGDLRFAYTVDAFMTGADAYAYSPGSGPRAGDVWFNPNGGPGSEFWFDGSYNFLTALHEIGHAIGLKHPFATGVTNVKLLDPALDHRGWTVMSYSSAGVGLSGSYSLQPTTPMVLDILAVQYLYGANTTTNAGNTIHEFTWNGSYHETIWDAGGIDTIVFTQPEGAPGQPIAYAGCKIDLNAGLTGSSRLGVPIFVNGNGGYQARVDNVYIAQGVLIENATGSFGRDELIGNAAGNVLRGGADVDILRGGGGNDTLDGGTAQDSLVGGAGNDVYLVDDSTDVVSPGASFFVDLVVETGTSAAEIDRVVSSVDWSLGANLENLTLTGGAGAGPTGYGNARANVIVGSAGDNRLFGGSGNDTLRGGAGIDELAGGVGNDLYILDDAVDRILEAGATAVDTDTVQSPFSWTLGDRVENLVLTGAAAVSGTGNGLGNQLTGNGAANRLSGAAGNDVLVGGNGNDSLAGGIGNDILDGGAGRDVITGGLGFDSFRFGSAPSTGALADRLADFVAADDRILLDDAVFRGIGGPGPLAAGAFRNGTRAGDANDRIVYDAATGQLFFDADGSGAGSAILFATFAAGTLVTAADLVVY